MCPSAHAILQARILAWVATPSCKGSSQPRDRTRVPASQADSLPSEPPGRPECGSVSHKRWLNDRMTVLLLLKSPPRSRLPAGSPTDPAGSLHSPSRPGHRSSSSLTGAFLPVLAISEVAATSLLAAQGRTWDSSLTLLSLTSHV